MPECGSWLPSPLPETKQHPVYRAHVHQQSARTGAPAAVSYISEQTRDSEAPGSFEGP